MNAEMSAANNTGSEKTFVFIRVIRVNPRQKSSMGVPLTYNLRNLVERKGTTLMTAIGIGLTVAVLITSVAMTQGMKAVFAGSGNPLHVLVLRKGVDAELSSTLSEEVYQLVKTMPGIAMLNGEPMV